MFKKNLACLIGLLLSCFSINAQMAVTAFETQPHDLDAKVNYKKVNPNDGKPYALIKISTSLSCNDFTRFDFGSVGYGEIDCTHGTWVYAPASASKLSITHRMAGTLENYLLPAPLEPGTVYTMTLHSGKVYTRVEQTLNAGFLVVECNINGAKIKIGNDEPEVMTGTRWTKTLPTGTYNYEITADNHETDRGRFEIKQEESTRLNITMLSSYGTLRLTSTPAGATVFIDGQAQNTTTPATLQLIKGTYHVMVSKDLYKSAEQEIHITSGQTTNLQLSLDADFSTVTIECADANDSIRIDNIFRATGTWKGNLGTGLHILEVSRASHRMHKQTFDVQLGLTPSLTIPALEPMYGKLHVEVEGSQNATVYVDGEKRSDMTPCVIKDVYVGNRNIRIVPDNKDYAPYETTALIKEAAITPVIAQLPSAIGSFNSFFPIYGFILGEVTTEDFKKKGYKVEKSSYGDSNYCDVNSLSFWDDDNDGVFEYVSIYYNSYRGDSIPTEWQEGLGLNWDISYFQLLKQLKVWGCKNFHEINSSDLDVYATTRDNKLELCFTFDNDHEPNFSLKSFRIRIQ